MGMNLRQLALKVSESRDQVSRGEAFDGSPYHVAPDGDDGEYWPAQPRIGLIPVVPLLPHGGLPNEPQDQQGQGPNEQEDG
jgi:hypothetical protein